MSAVAKVPMAPTATPSAATVPTSIFLVSGGLTLPTLAAPAAATVSVPCDSASAAAARFATCSSSRRTNFLYGAQKAWRMLIGLSTILVMVASQSRPCRS